MLLTQMIHKHTPNPFVVYTDLLSFLFMWAIALVCILLISIHKPVNNSHPSLLKPDAQYIIELTWDDTRDVDLDVWLQDPMGNIIYYGNREDTNISLDRDSRGFETNSTKLPDGQIVYSGNRELITIRAIIPGPYLIAVGYYNGKDEKTHAYYTAGDPKIPIKYSIKVFKVNPSYQEVIGKLGTLTAIKEAQNVVAFRVNADGTITILPLPVDNLIYKKGGGEVNNE